MKMIKSAVLGTLMVPAFVLTAGTASAQEGTVGTEATYLTSQPENTFYADTLIGNNIRSSVEDDENIGTINDFIIDEDGQVAAVIVGVGGFLGMGDKNVAIEWDSLEVTRDGDDVGVSAGDGVGDDYVIRVNASQDALEEAEEYERN